MDAVQQRLKEIKAHVARTGKHPRRSSTGDDDAEHHWWNELKPHHRVRREVWESEFTGAVLIENPRARKYRWEVLVVSMGGGPGMRIYRGNDRAEAESAFD